MSIKITIEADEGSLKAALGNLISDLAGATVSEPAAPVAEGERAVRYGQEARSAFVDFVSAWALDLPTDSMGHWDGETAASPIDRAELLRAAGDSALSSAMVAFIRQCGGLTHAVDLVLSGAEGDRPGRSRDVAVNIAQVASILFPDLADLLEHRDPTPGEE